MKNLVLVSLVLFTLTLSAQEKQNDATWDETVEFLEENISYLNGNYENYYSFQLFIENSNRLKIKGKDFDGKMWSMSLKLDDINKANMKSDKIILSAFGKVVQSSSGNFFPALTIRYENNKKEMASRIAKALKQIAYYNHQRQKKSKF